MKLATLIAVIAIPVLTATAASAAAPTDSRPVNEVAFQVGAEREITNDLMQATLVAELENTDPGRLAVELNRTMAWALEQVRADDGVRARSGNYRTWPVQVANQRRISHWRASQELLLETGEPERLNRLIGKLQERLQVRGMHFTVSPAQRRALEESLTTEALGQFRERAGAITAALDASGYDIAEIRIHGAGGEPPNRLMRTMSIAEDAPVASEPGVSRLGVTVDATIRLRFRD